ncbi:DUF2797 domain-containing protein [Streptomyces pactum]|uniref:DUF2797 domain-containing protein n=1 Tax=Streptomyces pactum TaxID=68249 RepID=UPI0036F7A6B3
MTGWCCDGLRWSAGGAGLVWRHPGHGERVSPLSPGRPVAFRTGARRGCTGVRRGARHTPCPTDAEVPAAAVAARCPECARLDRSYSVAADTRADDPRPYDVYLAWFAPGLIKVGITATEREGARLREQGALSFTLLGRGPLMAARRAEAVLGTALGVPDRFPYAARRAARHDPPGPSERAAELLALHARACALRTLPESLTPLPAEPVHHDAVFGLDRLREAAPAAGVLRLAPGRTVAGTVVAVAGPDVYLAGAGGRTVLLDVRQLPGWPLSAADPTAATTAEVVPPPTAEPETAALF